MDKETIRLLSLVKRSDYRTRILLDLKDNIKFPSEIVKTTNIRTSHISTALKELKKENLVELLNEEDKRGRLYRITEKGKEIAKLLK